MEGAIAIRGGWDRLRYTLTFEGLLIGLLAPALGFFFERGVADTGALALVISVKAILINYIYNFVYDRVDVHRGRVPTERSAKGRIVHAVGFETLLVATSLPIMMWWLDLRWWQALLMDLTLMSMVVVYTLVFTFAYDRVFPVAQPALES
jgi:uncharacterized membrane protein